MLRTRRTERRPRREQGLQNAVTPGARQEGKPSGAAASLRPSGRWLWFVALIVAVSIAAFIAPKAQPKAPPAAVDEAAVLAADTALANAMRGGDKSAARRLLALQFSFVDAAGKLYARKDFLRDLKVVAALPATDVKVRSYGNLTLITGRRLSRQNDDVFFLEIWARQKGAWRVLASQDVATAVTDSAAATGSAAAAKGLAAAARPQTPVCKNPCQSIPYRVRSASEQDVIAAFQALEKAIVVHDTAEYAKRVADEFTVYRSGRRPVGKSERIVAIERQKESNVTVTVGAVESMRLAVYGDAAAMLTDDVMPDSSARHYRTARLWVKRGGQWLLAISAQTDVK
jgi:Domain of unknown function (DUF4440)